METNPNIGYEGMLPKSKSDEESEKPKRVTKVYKGELEKLQEEYLARRKAEDARNLKIKAIQEEKMDMARRQAEKEKLAKEVKALRFKQSKTGRTVDVVKDVAKRSWMITKNVGHGLSVAGTALVGAVDQHSQHVAKVAQNPQQHIEHIKMARQAKVSPITPSVASSGVPSNLDAFVNTMLGNAPSQAPAQAQRAMYRKVKEKIRVKRGKKWITKTVTRRKMIGSRMSMQPKQAEFDFNAEMRKLEGVAGETPFSAPVKSKKGKAQGFDVNEMLKGMPQ
jgi:hypothetical protein